MPCLRSTVIVSPLALVSVSRNGANEPTVPSSMWLRSYIPVSRVGCQASTLLYSGSNELYAVADGAQGLAFICAAPIALVAAKIPTPKATGRRRSIAVDVFMVSDFTRFRRRRNTQFCLCASERQPSGRCTLLLTTFDRQ